MEIPKEKIEKYISPFHIDEDRQSKVYAEIKDNAKGDFDFYILVIFAAVIITLGLVINSSSVVIGGMLLAPLVWPILAISLAIVKGRSALLQESTFTLFKSTITILFIAIIFGFVSPDYALRGSEFLSRTSPTIFELFIALAAGFVGAFVIVYPKIGAAIAGVVIAAALVPPVAVMGVSIAHNNLVMAGGAFLLYLSNLIAVTFSSSVLFMLSKFKGPASEEAQEKRKSNIRWATVFLIVLAIPLLLITNKAIIEKKQQNIVRKIITAKFSDAVIDDVIIEDRGELLVIYATIQYPGKLNDNQIDDLTNILYNKMGRMVIPRITVIPTIRLWQE